MMDQSFKIGVDIGTTSTKAVLYNENYSVKDASSKSYPTIREKDGMAEQDPESIFQAVVSVLKTIHLQNPTIQNQIRSISFSSAMHSLLAISEEGEPLTALYTWADNRSAKVLENHQQKADLSWVYQRTGTPIHSMSPFSKLLWLQEEEPELFERTERFVGIKEYITYRFTGEWKVDYSIASATGLFNLIEMEWDKKVLHYLGLDRGQLSDLVDTDYVFTSKVEEVYRRAGLTNKTKLIIGASDGCLANLGLNAIQPNEVAMTIGTSGAVRMVADQIMLDPKGRTFCYYLSKNKWVIGGAVNNGGNTIEWLANLFSKNEQELNQLAEFVPPGSEDLLFYPYLHGERAPLWDASAQGHFIGMRPIHTAGHFVRAVMEGVLFNLVEVLHLLESIAGPTKVLKVNGGFLHSLLWVQLAADTFNRPLIVSSQFEASCLGAVLVGEQVSLYSKDQLAIQEKKAIPDATVIDLYRKKLVLYQKLAGPIKEIHAIKNKANSETS